MGERVEGRGAVAVALAAAVEGVGVAVEGFRDDATEETVLDPVVVVVAVEAADFAVCATAGVCTGSGCDIGVS